MLDHSSGDLFIRGAGTGQIGRLSRRSFLHRSSFPRQKFEKLQHGGGVVGGGGGGVARTLVCQLLAGRAAARFMKRLLGRAISTRVPIPLESNRYCPKKI